METSYIHHILLNRSKKANWPYMSSIILRNEDVPLFEEHFGQLDYDWLLKVTEQRVCCESLPLVIRYQHNSNLSKDKNYRARDYYMGMLIVDGNIKCMKRWNGSRARYFYKAGNPRMARYHFMCSNMTPKNVMYFVTSYFPVLRKIIIKKFNVSG